MREVSCRALGVVLKAARRRDISESVITRGLPYDLAYLRGTKNHIEWDAFCRVLTNLREVWSLEELSDLNEAFIKSPFFSYVGVVARMLFTSRDLFDWICKRQVGGGRQLFGSCVRPAYAHVGTNGTTITLEIVEPNAISDEFFWMTRGAFIAMPRLVGAGDADVAMTIEGRIGTFEVRYKNKRGTLASLFRWLSFPFTARKAAKELARTNEELQERYEELEGARTKLDRQARQLQTAHAVNLLVQRDLDLARTLETIAMALVDEAGFSWAEIRVGDGIASSGTRSDHEPARRVLQARAGETIGKLEVAGGDASERDELLEFVIPSLAMAVENAIYRTNLERLVDQRTTELRQALEQLREAQGVRERFFGNISHEFRTPLTIITLAASDVAYRAGGLIDKRSRDNLDAINDAAHKLVRLVDELLLLAAGQEGKLRLHPEPTDLVQLIRHLEAAWRAPVEAAGLMLSATTPDKLVANVDPVAFERVASNLISNAVKYTPRGGRVDLELDDGIRFSVLDTGPGIDDDLARRLFGRFERAAGERKQGAGLGLALVKQLVEAHGGTVEALARPTSGSELRVVLPAELVIRDSVAHPARQLRVVESIPAPIVASRSELTPSGVSHGTILLAEDDVQLADLIARALADEYTVVVAHDGIAALELARTRQPQLLITDVDMPGLDGVELSRRFRELAGDRLVPIIILSAMLDLGTRLAGLDAGAIDYVTKPFDPLELRARVRAQLRARELATRLHRAEQVSSLGILTSGLAHELRNPANAIVNAIQPLSQLLPADLKQPDHAVAQLLEVMREGAEQVGSLARQLLGFRSKGDLEVRDVSLRDLVQRAVSFAQGALSDVDVRLDIQVVSLRCAPPLMTQALTNLIENAGHAAGRGGWVEVRAHSQRDGIVIEVGDSGPGVPAALRDRVFEPFFTTKSPAGTGLGLSLARDIVQRHRGQLEIRDRGAASRFVIELGAVSASASAVDAI